MREVIVGMEHCMRKWAQSHLPSLQKPPLTQTHAYTHSHETHLHTHVCVSARTCILCTGCNSMNASAAAESQKNRQKNQTVVHEIIAVHREENTNKAKLRCVGVCVRVNLPIHVWSELNRLLSFLVFGLHLLLAFSLHLLLLLCIFMLCSINLVQNAHCKTFVSVQNQNSRNYFHLMSEIPSHSNWVHINFKTIFLLLSLVFVLYLLYGFWFPNPLTLVFFFFTSITIIIERIVHFY